MLKFSNGVGWPGRLGITLSVQGRGHGGIKDHARIFPHTSKVEAGPTS
jgi:hypothetical protein